MSKSDVGVGWFGRLSNQHMHEINARLEALEGEVRAGSKQNLTVSDEIRELQGSSEESVAEIKKLKSDVARLEKQLAWVMEEAQKTGRALFERVNVLENNINTTAGRGKPL